ncbi:MAG: SDR family NAD(P)-dependent oxidoreductase [Thermoprotei archaeon]
MRAVVTGGAGFIGSHLVDRLLADGYEVVAVDNLSTGTLDNLAHIKNHSHFRFVKADLRDRQAVMELLQGVDVVFHLAAHADIRHSALDHYVDLEQNVVPMVHILDGMLKRGVPHLVFASTSALYGEASVRPTPEEYSPIQTSLYGASKLACEAFAQAFTQLGDISVWSYRFSNVVGERARRGVIWDFVNKLKANPRRLEILGDGKQSKEYIYVSDCVDGIITGYLKSRGRVNTFNIAVDETRTVDQVADIVISELGLEDSGVERVYTGGPRGWVGDNPLVMLDTSKLKALGWTPKLGADEAIRRTARWTIKHLNTHSDANT